jgi:glycosyltransferase involved in cell wall biosynthesis
MNPETSNAKSAPDVLIFEPKTEGHHLPWLRMITEDLLAGGMRLTLAIDDRPETRKRVTDQLGEVLDRVTVMPAASSEALAQGRFDPLQVAQCLEKSGAARVFMPCFDEIASALLRRAAFGLRPPRVLKGRLGFIYHRPRVLMPTGLSLNRILKQRGFLRLLRGEWFDRILLLDEFLAAEQRSSAAGKIFSFLPTPSPRTYGVPRAEARRRLGLSGDKRVFLFYGGGYRRKGLHLAVDAVASLPENSSAFLLCAGQQPKDPELASGMQRLEAAGRVMSLNRYVTTEEEELCFCACDVVLVPYIKHFGVSAVLSQAVMADRLVIASDEELTGRRVRDYRLGLLFPSGNAAALAECIASASRMTDAEIAPFLRAMDEYRPQCTRAAFAQALRASFGVVEKPSARASGLPDANRG